MPTQSRRNFFASLAGIAGALGLRNHLAGPVDKYFAPYKGVTFRGTPLEWDYGVGVWNRVLTLEERQAIWKAGSGRSYFAPNDRS